MLCTSSGVEDEKVEYTVLVSGILCCVFRLKGDGKGGDYREYIINTKYISPG